MSIMIQFKNLNREPRHDEALSFEGGADDEEEVGEKLDEHRREDDPSHHVDHESLYKLIVY